MTHDPMCPFAEWPDESCYQQDAGVSICSLLARVREDERMIRQEEKRISFLEGQEVCILSYNKALRDAVEAVSRRCGHTKYEGCLPCLHDEAVSAIEALVSTPDVIESDKEKHPHG